MIRRMSWFVLGVFAVLSLAGQASAQVVVPGGQLPPLEGVPPELQKQIQEAFQRAAAMQGQPAMRGAKPSMRWGGLRLEKVSAEMQTQLGLEANEGLLITAVDANSVGDKAGVKPSDVLLKIGATAVPNDPADFAKLVKDQKENEPFDLVVIRKGKEETIKQAKMPVLVQNVGGAGDGMGGFGGFGAGGGFGRPGIVLPRNPAFPINPLVPGKFDKFHVEMSVNGAKLSKKQDGDKFSGEYAKDELKINVNGTLENGQPKIGEITVQEGKESKKYTTLKDVPAQHRATVQQLLPSPFTNMMIVPMIPNFQDFPGLPLFPDNE